MIGAGIYGLASVVLIGAYVTLALRWSSSHLWPLWGRVSGLGLFLLSALLHLHLAIRAFAGSDLEAAEMGAWSWVGLMVLQAGVAWVFAFQALRRYGHRGPLRWKTITPMIVAGTLLFAVFAAVVLQPLDPPPTEDDGHAKACPMPTTPPA